MSVSSQGLPRQALGAGKPAWPLAHSIESWSVLRRLLAILAQLAILSLIMNAWQIDNRAFRYQWVLICAGFVVNHFLPARLRLPFFSLFSLVAIIVLMRAPGAYVIGLGLLLIAVAHLPIAFWFRVGLLALVGVALAGLRGAGLVPQLAAVWPVLSSMFMFRMIIYLYDMRTGAAPVGLWQSLAYFFMVPNACFPLFPLADYKTFNRTYYNRDALDIYQKGVDWIVRGVIQLIGYRFVYQNLVMDPNDVADLGQLSQYLLANFLLYLRVSGNFHLIVGILHLFGFNLPETHHRYLLSSSFTDFWRRINIYWKDFIQKIFFYPVYFRVKKRGEMFALSLSTFVAFFATWALHSYQWFWLRGDFLITLQDISFWVILAIGVWINVLYEAKNPRSRVTLTWRNDLVRAVKTIAMFTFICILWSWWNTASLDEWLTMMSKARYASWQSIAWIAAGLLGLGVAAITMGRSTSERTDAPMQNKGPSAPGIFWPEVAKSAGAACLLLAVGRNPQWFEFAPYAASTLDRLTSSRLNAQDLAKLERGYYEDLIDETRFNPELAELYTQRPTDWRGVSVSRDRPGRRFPASEYIPNHSVEANGAQWSTNRWGMRDRDYEQRKPEGVYRIAIVGDSNSAGHYVDDDKVFERIVEERLEAERSPEAPKIEILNFSVASYGAYARLKSLEQRVFDFEPDMVVTVGVNDLHWIVRDVARCLVNGLDVEDAFVQDIVKQAALLPGVTSQLAEHRLKPHAMDLLRWTYAQSVDTCKRRNIPVYAAFLPRLDDRDWDQSELPQIIAAARDAGFQIMDLSDAFDHVEDWKELWARPWDLHPNAKGHQLIAERFHAKLKPVLPPTVQAAQPE